MQVITLVPGTGFKNFVSLFQVGISQKTRLEGISNFTLHFGILDSNAFSKFILCDVFSKIAVNILLLKNSFCYRHIKKYPHFFHLHLVRKVGYLTIMRYISFQGYVAFMIHVRIPEYFLLKIIRNNKCQNDSSIFHDGPGLASSVLIEGPENIIVFSSFQAVVLTVYKPDTHFRPSLNNSDWFADTRGPHNYDVLETKHEEVCMSYSGQILQGDNQLLNDIVDVDIKFPNNNCNNNSAIICVLTLKLPLETPIKLSIKKLVYNGPSQYNDDCRYGGISVYMRRKGNMYQKRLVRDYYYYFDQYSMYRPVSFCWNITESGDEEQLGIASSFNYFTPPDVSLIHIVLYGYHIYAVPSSIILLQKTYCAGFPIELVPFRCGIGVSLTNNSLSSSQFRTGSDEHALKMFPPEYCTIIQTKPLNIFPQDIQLYRANFCHKYTLRITQRVSSMKHPQLIQMMSINFPFMYNYTCKYLSIRFQDRSLIDLQKISLLIGFDSSSGEVRINYSTMHRKEDLIMKTDTFFSKETVRIQEFIKARPNVYGYWWEIKRYFEEEKEGTEERRELFLLYPLLNRMRHSWFVITIFNLKCNSMTLQTTIFPDHIIQHANNQLCNEEIIIANRVRSNVSHGYDIYDDMHRNKIFSTNQSFDLFYSKYKSGEYELNVYTDSYIEDFSIDNYFLLEGLFRSKELKCSIGSIIMQRVSYGIKKELFSFMSFQVFRSDILNENKFYIPITLMDTCHLWNLLPAAMRRLDYCLAILYKLNPSCQTEITKLTWKFAQKRIPADYNATNIFGGYENIVNLCNAEAQLNDIEMHRVCLGTISWLEAQDICRKHNMTLPSITSARQEPFWVNISRTYHQTVKIPSYYERIFRWIWETYHRPRFFYEPVGMYIGLNYNVST